MLFKVIGVLMDVYTSGGKNFISLEDSGVLLDESHLVDALGAPLPMPSPSRSSPRSQNSDNGERFSRKVFVGGLPPDIDEGNFMLHHCIFQCVFF